MRHQQTYFYATGVSRDGKFRAITIGPFANPAIAKRRIGDADHVQVWPLQTSDLSRAARMIRAKQLAATGSTESALQRQYHPAAEEPVPQRDYTADGLDAL